MENNENWSPICLTTMGELVKLINNVSIGNLKTKDVEEYIKLNKEKLYNPDYMQVLVMCIALNESFFRDNRFLCDFVYDFLSEYPESLERNYSVFTITEMTLFTAVYKSFIGGLNEVSIY